MIISNIINLIFPEKIHQNNNKSIQIITNHLLWIISFLFLWLSLLLLVSSFKVHFIWHFLLNFIFLNLKELEIWIFCFWIFLINNENTQFGFQFFFLFFFLSVSFCRVHFLKKQFTKFLFAFLNLWIVHSDFLANQKTEKFEEKKKTFSTSFLFFCLKLQNGNKTRQWIVWS